MQGVCLRHTLDDGAAQSDDVKRALFFSPYGQWHYHGACETTMGHALRARGMEVRFIGCDGLFPACDVFRAATDKRTPTSCLSCQKTAASLYEGMATPYQWLGRHVTPGVFEEISAWLEDIPNEALLAARYRGYPVGRWARSSVHFHFRASHIELADKELAQGWRDHILGCAIAIDGISRLLDDWRPDLVILLNGRFFSHWAAIELAIERGIRVVTHERGMRAATLRFAENGRVHDLALFEQLWSLWGDIPLNRSELLWIDALLSDRRFGRGVPYLKYSPDPEPEGSVREKLSLDGRPLVAMFSSSDDECAAFDERNVGAFDNSLEWLTATVRAGADLPNLQFIVRLHPNLTRGGINRQTMELAAKLQATAPSNVRIVAPDDAISSYTVADIATVGVVYSSTLGLEMAAGGQAVLNVARGWYGHAGFTEPVTAADHYLDAIASAAERDLRPETARRALRFAYRYFRELGRPFPWVREEPRHCGTLTYRGIDELMPGYDATLDAFCEMLKGERPLLEPPRSDERNRDTKDEDLFLEERVVEWNASEHTRHAG